MPQPTHIAPSTAFRAQQNPSGALVLFIEGRLDSEGTAQIWGPIFKSIAQSPQNHISVDGQKISYCDGSGISLLLEIERHQMARGATFRLHNLAPRYNELLKLYSVSRFSGVVRRAPQTSNFITETGRATLTLLSNLKGLITFVGELLTASLKTLTRPHALRWNDMLLVVEKAGVNAIPILALVGFLIGLIMSFQAAIPMRQFGAEIFVADLIGLSLFRELGPLVTAIILAGRSGAAFSAEIGTMKINEEINALTTMGINPVQFLVVTRMIAAIIVTPLLTIATILFGLVGGAVVFGSLGFPLVTFINQIQLATTYVDFLGGLAKSVVFGALIAGVGCYSGLRTRSGPSAVGDSTTQAVVSTLILIVVTDGVFSVLYYYLGI